MAARARSPPAACSNPSRGAGHIPRQSPMHPVEVPVDAEHPWYEMRPDRRRYNRVESVPPGHARRFPGAVSDIGSSPPPHPPADRSYGPISETRSEEHTSELQSHLNLVCRLLLEKKKQKKHKINMCSYV